MIHTMDSLQAIVLVIVIIELLLLPLMVVEELQDYKRKKLRALKQKRSGEDAER